MKDYIVIDIETEPLDAIKLAEIQPLFEPNKTLKDPEKIAANLAAKRSDWIGESALHAERGRVLAVGIYYPMNDGGEFVVHEGEEGHVLDSFWNAVVNAWTNNIIVGHNIWQFDLPFIVRRSFALNIRVPLGLASALQGYNPPREIYDTMLAWRLSNREERISLDTLAWHLGVGRKNGSGADFALLFKQDRAKALEYFYNDLKLTAACYERLTDQVGRRAPGTFTPTTGSTLSKIDVQRAVNDSCECGGKGPDEAIENKGSCPAPERSA